MKVELATSLKRQTKQILKGIARGEKSIQQNAVYSNQEAKEKM